MERHTVLVVDDEPASLRTLRRTLAPEYEVCTAESGAAALEILRRQPVSVLLTDHRMPGMTGVEVLVQSIPICPSAIRIVLTGYADIEAVIEAINTGEVYHYLTKPWEPRDLLLVMRRSVERLEASRERERLLRDLRAACDRVQREAEQKTRLLATAAHELGTPVHVVGNAVDLLASVPAARASEWMAVAERGVAWLERSLAQMQTAVRLRERAVVLNREALDLSESLVAVTTSLRRALSGRDLAIILQAEAPVSIYGDREWLRTVWINVLSNAVRATPDGGSILVSAQRVGGGVQIQVCDNGVGMTERQLAVLFEPFSGAAGDLLLHSSGRLEFGARGLGLGMWVVKTVVNLHGGTVEVTSAPGQGTTVSLLLPCGPKAR